MANVVVTEDEFLALAGAAYDALMRGDRKQADTLDKLARKVNAALSNERGRKASPFGRVAAGLSWKDVPSTLEGLKQ